jgi:hypothetical protein
MNIDRLLGITNIYVHGSCPDGTASARICEQAFRMLRKDPQIHSVQYGSELRAIQPQSNQLFVDITPSQDRWEEWKSVNPVVLDHHESVKHIVEGLDGVFGGSDESGASLAFEHIMKPIYESRSLDPVYLTDWQVFSHLSMIRDTWKKNDPLWSDAAALAQALLFYGFRRVIDHDLDMTELMRIGKIALDNTCRKAEQTAHGASISDVLIRGKTVKIGTFNCTDKVLAEAADILIDNGCNLVVGYFFTYNGTQKCIMSLRSDGSINVADLAKIRGGGGHARAASFTVKDGGNISPERILACVIDTFKIVI